MRMWLLLCRCVGELTSPLLQRAVSVVHMLVVPVLSSQGLPKGCALAQEILKSSLWSLPFDPLLAVRLVGSAELCIQRVSPLRHVRPAGCHPWAVPPLCYQTCQLYPHCLIPALFLHKNSS